MSLGPTHWELAAPIYALPEHRWPGVRAVDATRGKPSRSPAATCCPGFGGRGSGGVDARTAAWCLGRSLGPTCPGAGHMTAGQMG